MAKEKIDGNAWKSSPWSIRFVVIGMVAYIVIAPTLILNDYLGPNVRDAFLMFMGVGKDVSCR